VYSFIRGYFPVEKAHMRRQLRNVAFWHKPDLPECPSFVCYRGQSRHLSKRSSAFSIYELYALPNRLLLSPDFSPVCACGTPAAAQQESAGRAPGICRSGRPNQQSELLARSA